MPLPALCPRRQAEARHLGLGKRLDVLRITPTGADEARGGGKRTERTGGRQTLYLGEQTSHSKPSLRLLKMRTPPWVRGWFAGPGSMMQRWWQRMDGATASLPHSPTSYRLTLETSSPRSEMSSNGPLWRLKKRPRFEDGTWPHQFAWIPTAFRSPRALFHERGRNLPGSHPEERESRRRVPPVTEDTGDGVRGSVAHCPVLEAEPWRLR